MKKVTVVFAVLALSFAAYAGKQERDLVTKNVKPKIDKAVATLKESCGCDVKITLDETNLKTMDELRNAGYISEHLSDGAKKYCTDDASKKAICQMKTLTLTKGKPAGFTFKDGAGTATTDGQSSCSWEQMTRVLDK